MAKRPKLTDSQKAANIAAGLTPTGRNKITKMPGRKVKPENKGVRKAQKFPPGDYRCLGGAFTTHRKNRYLRVLRETGELCLARADVGVSQSTVYTHRQNDKAFKVAEEEARMNHASIYSQEMKRRAVDGVQEPVYGPQGPGAGSGILGYVTKYSDRLLVEQAKRHNREGYTPRQITDATVQHSEAPSLSLDQLSPESQAELLRILEREGVKPDGDKS